MASEQAARSADDLYREAREQFANIVDLDVYDNEDLTTPVAAILERARKQDPQHVPSLALLSDILMEIGADREAMEIVDLLLALQPDNATHVTKKTLLQQLQENRSYDTRDAVRAFVEQRWTQTTDW